MKLGAKEVILKESFKLFCNKRYEQVTVTDLERAIKLSRGSIFYHTKNKELLFKMVIDKYIFGEENSFMQSIYPKDEMTFFEYLEFYISWVESLKKIAADIGVKNINYALGNITNQALSYYSNFDKKATAWQNEQIKIWEYIIQRAVNNGELKKDIHVKAIAALFQYTYYGVSYAGQVIPDGVDITQLRNSFIHIYDSVKVK